MNCHLNGDDCCTFQELIEAWQNPSRSLRPSLPRLRSRNPASASLHNALLPNSEKMVPGSQLSAHTGERAPCWQAVLGMQMPMERIFLKDSKEIDILKSQLSASRIWKQLKVQVLELVLAWAHSYIWPLPSSAYLASSLVHSTLQGTVLCARHCSSFKCP